MAKLIAKRGTLTTISYAGAHRRSVDVINETSKRYRMRLRTKACLPSRGWVPAGTIVLVPKDSVTIEEGQWPPASTTAPDREERLS